MNRERSLKIVHGHEPLHVPAGAEQAGLTVAVALVLSTVRSDVHEMVLDHELWLACVRAVGPVVNATSSEVYTKPSRQIFEALRRPHIGHSIGSLDIYSERLLSDPYPPRVKKRTPLERHRSPTWKCSGGATPATEFQYRWADEQWLGCYS